MPVWLADELADLLCAPDAAESLSPVQGPGCLALDLEPGAADLDEAARDRILLQLPILPCVTIAMTGPLDEPVAARLAALCDVVVPDRRALAALRQGFEATPLAALAFVQLLRSAPQASLYAGIVAESFVYSMLQSGQEFQHWLAARRAQGPRSTEARAESSSACRIERDQSRLDIRLMRPHKHNAFSTAMRDGLCEALRLAASDPSIEDIVLSGEGESFCSGGDLDEFGSAPEPVQAHAVRTTRSPALLIAGLAERMRAEVQGACIGAGIELPAFARHVRAREDAFFALPEVGLGLVPGAGGTASLPRRIGRQRTAWLGLSGARIDAQTALDWGLVDEIQLLQHGGAPTGGGSLPPNG